MISQRHRACRGFLLLFLLTLLGGCGAPSPPVVFHSLAPVDFSKTPVPGREALAGLIVGVGPVTVPDLYNRPQIPKPRESEGILLDEFNHWGGNLDREVNRALTLALSGYLDSRQVIVFPWAVSLQPDITVSVDLLQFEVDKANRGRLNARWSILARHQETPRVNGIALQTQATGETAGERIQSLQAALLELGEALANDLVTHVHRTLKERS